MAVVQSVTNLSNIEVLMLLIIIIALLCFMLIICLVNGNYASGWQLVHVMFSSSFLVS
jgi:hypothetical protein